MTTIDLKCLPPKNDIAFVIDMLNAALSDLVLTRTGEAWADVCETGLVVATLTQDRQVKVAIGQRETMTSACIEDGIFSETCGFRESLQRPSPAGFAWVIVDWGPSVSLLAYRRGRSAKDLGMEA